MSSKKRRYQNRKNAGQMNSIQKKPRKKLCKSIQIKEDGKAIQGDKLVKIKYSS